MSSSKNPKCLIVCMTPLQALIAERIIELKKGLDFTVLYICYANHKKNYHYFEKLSLKANNSYFHFVENRLVDFIKFQILFDFKGYNSLYVSSFHNMYCRYIYSKNDKCDLYTYDDGFGNLNREGVFYSDEKMSVKRKVLYSIFGISKNNSSFRDNSLIHYTIYNGKKNIIDNTFFINLFNNKEVLHKNKQNKIKHIRFFIGQPLQALNPKYNDFFINSFLDKMQVDYYFPHPSESYSISNKCVVKTNLIFEDYVQKYIKDNPGCDIEVVSFFSTVLLNLKDQNSIEVKCVANNNLIQDFSDAYKVMNIFNIKLIKMDEL